MWCRGLEILALQLIILHNNGRLARGSPMYGENIRLAGDREFPYVVSIMSTLPEGNNAMRNHECSGTLVSPKDILTSAHCVQDRQWHEIKLMIGSSDLLHCRRFYPLSWITYDDWMALTTGYASPDFTDLAAIKLIRKVPDYIVPIAYEPVRSSLTGLEVVVAGWGTTSAGTTARFMEAVSLTVLSNGECSYRVTNASGKRTIIHPMYFCSTAVPYAVMGDGNSGGPVIHEGVLVGIHRGTLLHPDDNFHPNKINLHMSVKYFKDFIDDVIANN